VIHTPRYVLAVPDLARSAAWYRDVLGCEVLEIGDPGWRVFRRDGLLVMAGECPEATAPETLGDHAYFAYLDVDELDELFAEVRDAGAEVIKPLRDEPWGRREFALRTVDGHRIVFGKALAG